MEVFISSLRDRDTQSSNNIFYQLELDHHQIHDRGASDILNMLSLFGAPARYSLRHQAMAGGYRLHRLKFQQHFQEVLDQKMASLYQNQI